MPDIYDDASQEEVFAYLEALRSRGEINMFGAPAYLRQEFGLSRRDAKAAFIDWTKNRGSRG